MNYYTCSQCGATFTVHDQQVEVIEKVARRAPKGPGPLFGSPVWEE